MLYFLNGNNSMSHLPLERMVEAATVLQDSYQHVLNNIPAAGRESIIQFVAKLILSEKPYMLITPEGLSHISELVFSNDPYRDFIFTLSFTFFARFGGPDTDITGLAENLARGAAQVSPNREGNAIPNQIANRLIEAVDIVPILINNRWLMMILLIQLFITTSIETSKSPKRP